MIATVSACKACGESFYGFGYAGEPCVSRVIWPSPPRSYESRSRHRFVVQGAELGSSPWSDLESFRWRVLAITYAAVLPFFRSGRRQVVDTRPVSTTGSDQP